MTMTSQWVREAGLDPTLLTADVDKTFPMGRGWHYPLGPQCGAPTKTGGTCQRTLPPGKTRCYRHRDVPAAS